MKENAIEICREQETFAAIELLSKQPDQLIAVKTFHEVMRHFYWKEKDLFRATALGRAGLQYGLTVALTLQTSDPDRALEIRSAAKAMAYDLASFTWNGWDEPGIPITASDLQMGLDAARTNLRLAVELKKEALPLSRAYWMLGAQQLAANQFPEAVQSFTQAAEFSKSANTENEELLSTGFAALVKVLQTKGASGQEELEAIKQKLKPLTDGEFFVGQLETAYQVFSK
ncbi:MAG: hypothetical protein JWM11_56 [Planctomycetaceae bacterium]|nr:hypothetical protein [Planctomycetaceae bacterium]